MPDNFKFDGNTFYGPTAVGHEAHAEQHQHGSDAAVEALRREVAEIRRQFLEHRHQLTDPQAFDYAVGVIDGELGKAEPDKVVVKSWLQRLPPIATASSGLIEAVAKAYDIAANHWH